MLFRLTRGIKEWRIEYYRPTLQDDNEQDWHIITDANFGFPHSASRTLYVSENKSEVSTHATFGGPISGN